MKTNHSRIALAALFLLLLSAGDGRGQTSGDADLARRTFENAEQLMREGKKDQAIRDYQQVVQAFPESVHADDALMRLGGHHYAPESLWQLGAVRPSEHEAARPYFEQVRERYPQSDTAPHALYKLGLLSLEPHSARRNLDEAYASFSRVVNIYPDSLWVGPALQGAAYSELSKYNYDRAILSLERSLDETGHGAAAAEAQFLLGLSNARLGDFVRAAEAFQQSRLEDPDGAGAGSALDWLTLLYRTRLRPETGRPLRYDHDPAYVPRAPAGEDLRGDLRMAVGPSGSLVVSDPKRGALLTFGRDGSLEGEDAFPEAEMVVFDGLGSLMVVGPSGIDIDGNEFPASRQDGSKVKPVEKVAGVWRSTDREIYVLARDEGEVLLYGSDPQKPRVIVRDKEAGTKLAAMAAGPEGRLYFLDEKEKRVVALEGRALKSLAPAGKAVTFEAPIGLAVDNLGNLYVLDERRKAVTVLSPDGSELSTISAPVGSAAALEGPGSLAVGPRGEVYVYDKRKKTILLFR
jgi:TolA-binding protein